MTELISIREASRRLGVSDTAVHKAIKAGRVHIAGRTPGSDRPLVVWPAVQADWLANSDGSKRSHVGSQGSPVRARDPAPVVRLATSGQPDAVPEAVAPAPEQRGPSYAQSRAVREAYQARLAKLDFETRSGKLVDADQVKMAWYKQITAAKTRIMGIPSACKTRCSDLPLAVVATIEAVCRETLENLSNGVS